MQNCRKVTLRLRRCKHGMLSYYLDYYPAYRDKKTMKTIRRESLGIYIYENPQKSCEIALNRSLAEKAEIIRCRRYEEVINERYSLFDKQQQKESFVQYFKKESYRHNEKWIYVYKHFAKYVHDECSFGDVTVELCRGFAEYLQKTAVNMRTGQHLTKNSAAGYWATFRASLRIAYKNKLLNENINDFLDHIGSETIIKDSLTLQEIPPFRLRSASIFVMASCIVPKWAKYILSASFSIRSVV